MMKRGPKPQDVRTRFERHFIPEPNTGCWLWTGGMSWDGYGRFKPNPRLNGHGAHRVSYELYKSAIPAGMQIDHLCRMRCCVNPDHLEIVTQTENAHRSPITNATKKFCKNGHEFNAANTHFYFRDGKFITRRCRICWRERTRCQ
jgi:hypothetical protein